MTLRPSILGSTAPLPFVIRLRPFDGCFSAGRLPADFVGTTLPASDAGSIVIGRPSFGYFYFRLWFSAKSETALEKADFATRHVTLRITTKSIRGRSRCAAA